MPRRSAPARPARSRDAGGGEQEHRRLDQREAGDQIIGVRRVEPGPVFVGWRSTAHYLESGLAT